MQLIYWATLAFEYLSFQWKVVSCALEIWTKMSLNSPMNLNAFSHSWCIYGYITWHTMTRPIIQMIKSREWCFGAAQLQSDPRSLQCMPRIRGLVIAFIYVQAFMLVAHSANLRPKREREREGPSVVAWQIYESFTSYLYVIFVQFAISQLELNRLSEKSNVRFCI